MDPTAHDPVRLRRRWVLRRMSRAELFGHLADLIEELDQRDDPALREDAGHSVAVGSAVAAARWNRARAAARRAKKGAWK
ncbi:MAG: hypothetical protein VYE81_05910 [Planctomycetota bacterium]|nr:hypothetical protein [Planctomycetota bacterium]